MIFVFQDESKIPAAWFAKVARLQETLEGLADSDARKAFIDSKSTVWGEIKNRLLEMSAGKCWYSEAPDAVSDWHVDHFRPKKRALDEDGTENDGYHWLAFDWRNYRIAGSYPNSPHKDQSGIVRGKWDYFPLAPGCERARWDERNCAGEIYLFLDPTDRNDPKLMTFDERGLPLPATPHNPIVRKRVETTVHFLNLDHERLVSARKQKWREVNGLIEEFVQACPDTYEGCTVQDHQRVARVLNKLANLSSPENSFVATARACLKANELGWVIPGQEEALAA